MYRKAMPILKFAWPLLRGLRKDREQDNSA
jgi:hypothetical protein